MKKFLIVILLSFGIGEALTTRYVNVNADAGGNGTTTALTGANCAYTSDSIACALTLIANDAVLILCHAAIGDIDRLAVTVPTRTGMSKINYTEIRGDNDTLPYTLMTTNVVPCIAQEGLNIKLTGLKLMPQEAQPGFYSGTSSQYNVIQRCIFKSTYGSSSCKAILSDGGGTDTTSIIDCSFDYDGGTMIYADAGSAGRTNVYNCTFVGANICISGDYGTVVATNCRAYNCITFYSGTVTITTTQYTVTYNGNGNSGGTAPTDGSSPYDSNSTVTVLGNTGTLVKTGNTFNNWNTAANGSGTDYAPSATFAIAANTTLYAQWTIIHYQLTNANDGHGTFTPASGLKDSAASFNIDASPIIGYRFAGWTPSSANVVIANTGLKNTTAFLKAAGTITLVDTTCKYTVTIISAYDTVSPAAGIWVYDSNSAQALTFKHLAGRAFKSWIANNGDVHIANPALASTTFWLSGATGTITLSDSAILRLDSVRVVREGVIGKDSGYALDTAETFGNFAGVSSITATAGDTTLVTWGLTAAHYFFRIPRIDTGWIETLSVSDTYKSDTLYHGFKVVSPRATYIVTIVNAAHAGVITPASDTSIDSGSMVKWTFTHPAGYLLSSVIVSGGAHLNGTLDSFYLSANGTLTFSDTIIHWLATNAVIGSGSFTPATGPQDSGAVFTIIATPGSYSAFSSWSVSGGAHVTSTSVSTTTAWMTAAGTITANFVYATPVSPTKIYPADGDTIKTKTVTLRWHPQAEDSFYIVQTDASLGFASAMLTSDTITDTVKTKVLTKDSTTYRWRVRGSNNGGTISGSTLWSFRVQTVQASGGGHGGSWGFGFQNWWRKTFR